jgi:hypothetical protein
VPTEDSDRIRRLVGIARRRCRQSPRFGQIGPSQLDLPPSVARPAASERRWKTAAARGHDGEDFLVLDQHWNEVHAAFQLQMTSHSGRLAQ